MNPLFSGSGFPINPQLVQLARMMNGGMNPQSIITQVPQLQQVLRRTCVRECMTGSRHFPLQTLISSAQRDL